MSTPTSRHRLGRGTGDACGESSTPQIPAQRGGEAGGRPEAPDGGIATPGIDELRVRRRELVEQLRACRYLHRLVRSQLDLSVARATLTGDDLAALTPLQQEIPAVGEVLALLGRAAAPADEQNGVHALAALVRRLETCERRLSAELDQITTVVVAALSRDPAACLSRLT